MTHAVQENQLQQRMAHLSAVHLLQPLQCLHYSQHVACPLPPLPPQHTPAPAVCVPFLPPAQPRACCHGHPPPLFVHLPGLASTPSAHQHPPHRQLLPPAARPARSKAAVAPQAHPHSYAGAAAGAGVLVVPLGVVCITGQTRVLMSGAVTQRQGGQGQHTREGEVEEEEEEEERHQEVMQRHRQGQGRPRVLLVALRAPQRSHPHPRRPPACRGSRCLPHRNTRQQHRCAPWGWKRSCWPCACAPRPCCLISMCRCMWGRV